MNKGYEKYVFFVLHTFLILIGAAILSRFMTFIDLDFNIAYVTWVVIIATFKVEYTIKKYIDDKHLDHVCANITDNLNNKDDLSK